MEFINTQNDNKLDDDSINRIIDTMYELSKKLSVPDKPKTTVKAEAPVETNSENKPQFQFGPNTHEIRGFSIDFDRVAAMEKTDGEYNGNPSYGITFTFKGKKGSTRTIWFGRGLRDRDATFVSENTFWESVKK